MERNYRYKRNKFITCTALVASAYAALTYAFAFMSYNDIKFRISEILILFVFIETRYGLGLILGCILANIASPLGAIDIVVGSFATLMAIIYIIAIRKSIVYNKKAMIIASLGPVWSNGLFVGLELTYLFNTPFILNALYLAIGEFVVVTSVGTVVINSIMKNNNLLDRLSIN